MIPEKIIVPDAQGPDPGATAARPEPLVDPAVARAKFERQLADYRAMELEYIRRGWLMIRAEFPEVVVLFSAPHLAPAAVLFGVVLDFTNYDLWAPSVRFVKPFTLEPMHASEAPLILKRGAPGAPVAVERFQLPLEKAADGVGMEEPPAGEMDDSGDREAQQRVVFPAQPQNLVQAQQDGVPFLCIAGVREYHEHPFHSNDPWLAHRATGVGTLVHILNVIHTHGILPVATWNFRFHMKTEFAGARIDPNRLPA